MTDTTVATNDDLIGLSLMNLIGGNPSLANERIVTFRYMEPR